MPEHTKELTEQLALALAIREIEAWRRGINVRNMNKCKTGAIFMNLTTARAAITAAELSDG